MERTLQKVIAVLRHCLVFCLKELKKWANISVGLYYFRVEIKSQTPHNTKQVQRCICTLLIEFWYIVRRF
jgi:hypothetical protein